LAELRTGKIASGIVVPDIASSGKLALVGFRTFTSKFHAGNIIKKVAEIVGGSGGWRPDCCPQMSRDAENIDQALQAVYNTVAGI